MIHTFVSRSNHPIFTWNERYLCSRVDPISEAKEWLNQYKGQVQSCSEIIVLGLGCGFHVLELLKEFNNKKVIVIETQNEIWNWFSKHYPIEAVNFKCLIVKNEEDLLASSPVQSSVKRFYTILTHNPSFELFPSFKIYQKWLLGRSYDSLNWLTQVRSDDKSCNWQIPSFYDVNKDGLTLLELQVEGEKNSVKPSSGIHQKIRALKELIV